MWKCLHQMVLHLTLTHFSHEDETEMKQKLKCLKHENKRMCAALESQCAENVKVNQLDSHVLSSLRGVWSHIQFWPLSILPALKNKHFSSFRVHYAVSVILKKQYVDIVMNNVNITVFFSINVSSSSVRSSARHRSR